MIRWRDERGFTLVQLLVACGMLGLALAAVGTVVERGLRHTYISTHKTEVQQNARVALERMAREIRENPFGIAVATTNAVPMAIASADSARGRKELVRAANVGPAAAAVRSGRRPT